MTNPIDALMVDDTALFKNVISDTLMQKLHDRLEVERMEVGAQMFISQPEVTDEPQASDGESNV